jgi:PIN domain nuclease of toxin-antitoxin system
MILLDTNAVLWLHHGHRRGQRLENHAGQLYVSPASLLEIQFLVEAGRIRLRTGAAVGDLGDDDRWAMDNPY